MSGSTAASQIAGNDGCDRYGNRTDIWSYSAKQYAAAGNQTRALIPGSRSSQRFQYDAANRLVQVKADNNTTAIATYTYVFLLVLAISVVALAADKNEAQNRVNNQRFDYCFMRNRSGLG